ncbi:MAG: substrate-binding domain-containing protein, partial [Phycisphaerae bacterium]|nr:substrate-binding domain-containing protein [Phycisphaerae bacterium]
ASHQRNSAGNDLGTIGVALSWSDEFKCDPTAAPYYELAGISEALQDTNISQATYFVGAERRRQILESQYPFPEMRDGRLSGLILIYTFSRDMVRHLAGEVPCVSIIHPHLDLGVDCIDNDYISSVGTLVHRLHGLGHRRIGFLSGSQPTSWTYPRFAGYMRALDQLSLPRDTNIEINLAGPRLDVEAQADAVAQHVRRGVTAWVCADDYIGYDLYPELTARGLRVPQDVSLAGFSGLEPEHGCPRLTSVRPPFEQMGAAAVRQLINRIKHPEMPASHVQFGCEFIEGETIGPPP